jgi:hypothetical protein
MRTVAKMAFGGIMAAVLVVLGPTGYEQVAKLFQPLPLSPLAKVVLEKLETSSWTVQQDGISCDTLWIRGETDGRQAKSFNCEDLKTCSVFVRQGGLSKELALNDQLQPHEVKAILPKAKAMYAKLMAERNAETASKIAAESERLDPPAKKKPAAQFTTNGKLIFDGLTAKNWKVADNSLVSKTKGSLVIDLNGKGITLSGGGLELNGEEVVLIVDKARNLRDDMVQKAVQNAVQSELDAQARITAELADKTVPVPMPTASK